eukprot:gnl/Spiro4/15387_TR8278_c1_g1_i1.p2 gnl/Spiro4/15387_TR8278_c1_g1~~gnl/Spiro4/15387_TR8278_c1_g1_i1.p2  ORF type:complete len:288 (-),score=80.56 gnl/Spiro4/15387_TR8278_c1_g1_i1:52-915(-)
MDLDSSSTERSESAAADNDDDDGSAQVSASEESDEFSSEGGQSAATSDELEAGSESEAEADDDADGNSTATSDAARDRSAQEKEKQQDQDQEPQHSPADTPSQSNSTNATSSPPSSSHTEKRPRRRPARRGSDGAAPHSNASAPAAVHAGRPQLVDPPVYYPPGVSPCPAPIAKVVGFQSCGVSWDAMCRLALDRLRHLSLKYPERGAFGYKSICCDASGGAAAVNLQQGECARVCLSVSDALDSCYANGGLAACADLCEPDDDELQDEDEDNDNSSQRKHARVSSV